MAQLARLDAACAESPNVSFCASPAVPPGLVPRAVVVDLDDIVQVCHPINPSPANFFSGPGVVGLTHPPNWGTPVVVVGGGAWGTNYWGVNVEVQ